ncbi:zinc-binding dehydrogenase [soil metagenome]
MSKGSEIVFTALRHAELRDYEVPALAENQIQGRTHSTLVSPGTELNWGYLGKDFPNRPGYASVWEVERVGAAVTLYQPGDMVLSMAAHQSHPTATERDVVGVPAGLAPSRAVLARLMAVSMTTLFTTRARTGDGVVVTGLGPVGLLAALMARHCGYRVAGVDLDAQRREWARQKDLKVHEVMPLEPWKEQAALVMECSGHEQAVLDACGLLRRRGELVLIGVPWNRLTDLSAHQLLHAIFHRWIDLRSGWEWELPWEGSPSQPHSTRNSFETALRWLSDGAVAVDDLCCKASPTEAANFYEEIAQKQLAGLFPIFDWLSL